MNTLYKTVWNESLGIWVVVDEHAASRGKSSRGARLAVLRRAVVIGLVSLGANTLSPSAFASTYNPSGCSSPGDGLGPDNATHPAGVVPVDGSGVWSNVIGCSASGNDYLGVQVMGAYATANGDAATAIGFAAKAGLRGTALGMRADASGVNSTAVGSWAQATKAGGVAIGGTTTTNTAAAGAQSTGANALAIIGGSRAAGDESIALGARASAAHNGDIAIGADAVADGTTQNLSAVAIGRSASAVGEDATAYGNNAKANANYAAALGNYASASGTNSLAVGNSSNASASYATALGNFASASSTNALALGNSATASGASASAVGNFSRAEGSNSIAMGTGGSFGSYTGARAVSEGSIAIGGNTAAASYAGAANAIALGGQANVADTAVSGIALGRGASVSSDASYAIAQGDDASAQAERSIALGAGATAANAGDIALGAGSRSAATVATAGATIDGTQYAFAGSTPGSTLSIGDAGAERTLTNVAAGRISATSTDAINGSQLAATNQALEGLSDNAVKYDQNSDGSPNYNQITLNPGGSATKISNVADGELSATSSDAVNGKQLNETNQNITRLGDDLGTIAGDTSTAYTDANGMGIRYARTNENGLAASDASAQGQGSTALGYNATASADSALALGREANASHAGSVALGANAIADGSRLGDAAYAPGSAAIAGISPVGEVSIGSDGAERRLTHVAAGANDTDAVNVSQLKSVAESVDDLDQGSVKYDKNPDGSPNYNQITLNPGGSATKISNVADGELSATSGDAVNGKQLNETNQNVTRLGDDLGTIAGDTSTAYTDANGMGIRYARTNENGLAASDASAQGQGSTALGYNATASADSALALGREANASHAGSVALGANAIADGSRLGDAAYAPGSATIAGISPVGEVSIGSDGAERRLTHVAAGANDTDAVNVSQLKSVAESLDDLDQGSVKYDKNPDGSPNYNQITLNPGGSATKISNVADGELSATSGDAVNGKQLNETNQNVTRLGDDLVNIAGDTSTAYTDANGKGIRYARTNETGLPLSDASAQGQGSTAVGYNATASADNALALGRETSASVAGGVALGSGSVSDRALVPSTGSIASGSGGAMVSYNTTDRTLLGAVSVGDSTSYRQITNVADGTEEHDAVTVRQLTGAIESVTVTGTRYFHANSTAGDSLAAGEDAVAIGPRTVVNGDNGVGIGNGAIVEQDAPGGIALGQDAHSRMADSIALGTRAQASSEQGVALGAGSNVTVAGGVALGAGSVASTAAGAQGYVPLGDGSGINATNSTLAAVSVGDASTGKYRQITGVAAGTADSDAVNVSQLKSVAETVTQLDAGAVKYDKNADGSINYNHITLNPGGSATRISNIADGELSATSTDAVNGSQLHATNKRVDALDNRVDGIVNGGAGIKYVHTNGGPSASLPDSQANGIGSTAIGAGAVSDGENSVAMGNGATAKQDGDVALGAGSVADRGAESYTGDYSGAQNNTAGTVSVGAPGAERTVSNVADGRLDTDAVNKRQLDGAVKDAKDYTDQRVKDINGSIVEVGEDLEKLDERVTQNEGDVQDIKKGAGGMFQTHQGDKPNTAPKASGRNSVAGGAGAVASGENATALGNDAKASGNNATAVGNGSSATGSNSVALGQGSQATRDNSVAVGAEGAERQITHVAAGTAGTDAVNVNQLREMENSLGREMSGLRNDMQHMDNRLSAGIAGAMAMASLPQAYEPGKSMVSLGGATWRGESGLSLGLSAVSDNGKWVVKGLANTTSRGDVGAAVGVGYQW
ncbi:YadA-like family protein [Pseudomonas guariconensis]|uniref:YadA-like family protein n=1 Tax=Pseudomonas guariconensis TaxID=1288410 RepID=UPI0018AA06B7|nr:YadA-like family protein [Pseudomonas guariconensis]MBF8740612.1 YadA-like family protein [Pseudomonas guariconensis]MBF8749792.1 YadA-like family protein [Pseudomonas guariconensis]